MADLSIAGELLAQSLSANPALRVLWGRLQGGRVYLDDAPDHPVDADNAAGPLLDGQRVMCIHQQGRFTIIGPTRGAPSATAGSNSNGSWWRSPDGLQVCWIHTTEVRAATASYGGILHQSRWEWRFPLPFWGQPVAACTTWLWSTGASWGTTSGAPSTTSVLLRGIDGFPRTTADPLVIDAMAVGRWRS